MRTAIWLYLFLFVALFDLHAQYPILTPFAISLGAAPSFIGLMMGMYSITHVPGNLLAGFSVDRYGSRLFIVLSLLLAGVILLFQAHVSNPWQLLLLRSISGFVLAFLSPACMTLLAKIAKDHFMQRKLMTGNGLVHTLASIVSPAAGAILVAKIGFSAAFTVLGWTLIVIAFCALLFIHDQPMGKEKTSMLEDRTGHTPHSDSLTAASAGGTAGPYTWIAFLLPIGISCSQGILFFELPLMDTSQKGMLTTGLLFSLVSIGSLVTLSMLFLNRFSPFNRTMVGTGLLAMTFYGMAAGASVPLFMMLLIVGMAKGVLFPAMSSMFIELSGRERYGRMFSFMSIAFSVGAFVGPLAAGVLRDYVSSYFVAFVVLMLVFAVLPLHRYGIPATTVRV
ncbi:MFS transporter [Brevibacillus migulae]|uniref:MFS transporter n=1 Tax=Brevibacillus migulae TaxID=1644114 RepID=UPI00106DF7E3